MGKSFGPTHGCTLAFGGVQESYTEPEGTNTKVSLSD